MVCSLFPSSIEECSLLEAWSIEEVSSLKRKSTKFSASQLYKSTIQSFTHQSYFYKWIYLSGCTSKSTMSPQNNCREIRLKMLKSGFQFPRVSILPNQEDLDFLSFLTVSLAFGWDVNSVNTQGESLLLWLIENFPGESLPRLVDWLIGNGAKPDKKHPKTKENALELLLRNLGSWRERSLPPLFQTAIVLIQSGLNVNKWKPAPDVTRRGSSHYSNVTLQVLRFILDSGSDVNSVNENGMNLLMDLSSDYFKLQGLHGKIELARMLIERGIDVNKTADFHIYRSLNSLNLLCVARNGKFDKDFCDLVELFVSSGMNVNNVFYYGNEQQIGRRNSLIELCLVAKPPDQASAEGIASLIKHGIDVHFADLHNAVTALCSRQGVPHLKGVLHLARILVSDCKVAVNLHHKSALANLVANYFGPTTEMQINGQSKVLLKQIAPGKNVWKKSEDNERDFYSLVELLLSNTDEFSNNIKREMGEALLQLCFNYTGNNIVDVIELLCDYGADVNMRMFTRDSGLKIREYNAVEMVARNREQKHRAGQVYCVLSSYGFNQNIAKDYIRDGVVKHLYSAECSNICTAVGRRQQLGDRKRCGTKIGSQSLANRFSRLNV